jgi:hypothetical protein
MHRSRFAITTACLIGLVSGCGESQPNAPAKPEETASPDFGTKTGDMMKAANTGMDPKKVPKGAVPK